MKNFLIFFFFIFSSNISQASFFDKKLTVYKCENEDDVNACANSCKKTDVQISFDADKGLNKVMMTVYSSGSTRNVDFENCTVFNKSTFTCGVGFGTLGGVYTYEKRVLKNNKYTAVFTNPSLPAHLKEFTCAK